MTLIAQFIMDIYTYIINIIFPKEITDNATVDNQCIERTLYHGRRDGDGDESIYIQQYGQPFVQLDNNKEQRQYLLQKNKQNGSYGNNTKTNNNPFKKTQSFTQPNYYCGFCSRHIQIPTHMYADKSYCSVICRNKQINVLDKSQRVRQTHSFSV